MATLTVTSIGRAGQQLDTPMTAAAGGGDNWPNTGVEFLVVTNGDATPTTVTLTFQRTVDGQSATARTVSVTNGKTFVIGPFPTANFNDGNARAGVTYSKVTSLTVGVFSLGA